MNNVNIISVNVRSIHKNLQTLLTTLCSLKIIYDIIVLTEVWLTNYNENLFEIPNFNHISLKRENKRGGGIRIYFRENVTVNRVDNLSQVYESLELLLVNVTLNHNFNFLLAGVYRPPNCSLMQFNNFLEHVLFADCNVIRKKVVLTGDFNIDVSCDNPIGQKQIFLNLMEENGYIQFVNDRTRCDPQTGVPTSLLDHVWCNFTCNFRVTVVDCPVSDHLPVVINFHTPNRALNLKVKFRDFSASNMNRFTQESTRVFSSYSVNMNGSAELEFTRFTDFIASTLNTYFPIRTKFLSIKRLEMPWLSGEVIQLINKKHQLFRCLKLGLVHYQLYKTYSKTLQILIKKLKSNYYSSKFVKYRNNSKKTWQLINVIYGRGKRRVIKTIRLSNGNLSSDEKDIADDFNAFFTSIPLKTQSDLNAPLYNYDHLIPNNIFSMYMCPTTSKEMEKIIKNLNNNGSTVDLPIKFIKCTRILLATLLSDIFNLCFSNQYSPSVLKTARIVPIYKAGNAELMCNYRPISILPIINKIFEKVIYTRIVNFISHSNILSPNQFGFRAGLDTEKATLKLIISLLPSFVKKERAASLFLDFSKAFDTVDRELLLNKLFKYGIRGPAYSFIKSYLKDRKQFTGVSGYNSELMASSIGVPQGSCLGPLFFILYTNDLNVLLNRITTVMYADDTTIVFRGQTDVSLFISLKYILEKVLDWCNFNKLALNVNKTKLMLFNVNKRTFPEIQLNNKVIEVVSDIKYLGFTLDDKLSHKYHVKSLISKLRKLKWITLKIRKLMSLLAAKTFYYGNIFSILSYGILVWGGTLDTGDFGTLTHLQDRIVFNLFAVDNDTMDSVSKVYKRHHLLTIADLYKFKACLAVFSVLYCNSMPFVLNELHLLVRNHNHATRYRPNFLLPVPIKRSIKLNFIYQALKCWNSLDIIIRNSNSLKQFKHKLRTYIFSQY